jgi:hypothetical protein
MAVVCREFDQDSPVRTPTPTLSLREDPHSVPRGVLVEQEWKLEVWGGLACLELVPGCARALTRPLWPALTAAATRRSVAKLLVVEAEDGGDLKYWRVSVGGQEGWVPPGCLLPTSGGTPHEGAGGWRGALAGPPVSGEVEVAAAAAAVDLQPPRKKPPPPPTAAVLLPSVASLATPTPEPMPSQIPPELTPPEPESQTETEAEAVRTNIVIERAAAARAVKAEAKAEAKREETAAAAAETGLGPEPELMKVAHVLTEI